MSDLLIPEGALLVHIGPHKTGTTAIQTSLQEALPVLEAHGVKRLGRTRHPVQAVGYAVNHMLPYARRKAGQRAWNALVAEARSVGHQRAVVSSEYFSDADGSAAADVIAAFGEEARVVITLRPLSKILPSQWQQYVLRGLRTPYDEWLAAVLDDDRSVASRLTPSFWKRHRHDELVDRWAAAADKERVTVLVLDPDDRDMLNRSFEQMLGLPEGTLSDAGGMNRSFTFAEAEALRAYNRAYFADGQSSALHAKLARTSVGAIVKQRTPAATEGPVPTPSWAIDRAAEIGAEMAGRIAASGVRIVGDLDVLAARSSAHDEVEGPHVPPEVAGLLALAVLKGQQREAESALTSGRALRTVDSSLLTSELLRRGRLKVRRALRRG